MKHLVVHFKNKFPECSVIANDKSLDVYSKNGLHLVHIEKNGFGIIVDKSKEYGCHESMDLSPIAKESRIYKLHANGEIGLDEEHEFRRKFVSDNVEENELGYKKIGKKIEILKKEVKSKTKVSKKK